jgi:hypothetical protein
MLGAARVGFGLGILSARGGPGASRLRGAGAGLLPLGYSQRGVGSFSRFFGRAFLPRQQQQQQQQKNQPLDEKEHTDGKSKHVDTGLVNPVNLPGTGVGIFGFGGGGGGDAVITTLIGISVGMFIAFHYTALTKDQLGV